MTKPINIPEFTVLRSNLAIMFYINISRYIFTIIKSATAQQQVTGAHGVHLNLQICAVNYHHSQTRSLISFSKSNEYVQYKIIVILNNYVQHIQRSSSRINAMRE